MNQASFAAESRVQAVTCAQGAIGLLARAFNHCNEASSPYRYAADVQHRFAELAAELVALVEGGDIEANPGHTAFLALTAAKQDKALQAVLRRATRKPRAPRSSTGKS